MSLPGVVSFSTALYHSGSVTIGLSLFSYRFGFVFCYLNRVFPSFFVCFVCIIKSLCCSYAYWEVTEEPDEGGDDERLPVLREDGT